LCHSALISVHHSSVVQYGLWVVQLSGALYFTVLYGACTDPTWLVACWFVFLFFSDIYLGVLYIAGSSSDKSQ